MDLGMFAYSLAYTQQISSNLDKRYFKISRGICTNKVGGYVISGAICENGVLEIEVLKPVGESTVAKIIAMVEDAQKRKVHIQLSWKNSIVSISFCVDIIPAIFY